MQIFDFQFRALNFFALVYHGKSRHVDIFIKCQIKDTEMLERVCDTILMNYDNWRINHHILRVNYDN